MWVCDMSIVMTRYVLSATWKCSAKSQWVLDPSLIASVSSINHRRPRGDPVKDPSHSSQQGGQAECNGSLAPLLCVCLSVRLSVLLNVRLGSLDAIFRRGVMYTVDLLIWSKHCGGAETAASIHYCCWCCSNRPVFHGTTDLVHNVYKTWLQISNTARHLSLDNICYKT